MVQRRGQESGTKNWGKTMAKTKEEMDAEFNAYEDEHCEHLRKSYQIAREMGFTVGTGLQPPELNPDGSYKDAPDGPAPEEDSPNTAKKPSR